ncbi:23S rRNA (guanosine(2251)-2'-O)-methyltransferase RlmB [Blochmannia endosymbiont of Colobopsis nipponica]|uniref:23S rRNA (guanosine(2251)-2'-O)-methyltransferase RlmB n=1 Tax=Blochmannia endosymbiont of Colobopsis nipponica TaxID=2681987 RepID=UPI00177C964E|nr:23S rRNA (guanosine(2251)-2'-O)-methyltransferase RlmB [Blochmannia endosymbiont of Colobopsis nipponica]QOI10770.1 23S rRNA (guanosine(2251)-2'-O)-methyltransferase RlmB [Blochmannia endosymbiont of Colobopsis nipponica]
MCEFIYGIHAIQSLLDKDPHAFLKVYITNEFSCNNNRLKILFSKLEEICLVEKVQSRYWLLKKIGFSSHQGIVAKVRRKIDFRENYLLDFLAKEDNPLILVLDCVTDPHNLGACLRCASVFGVHVVIVPRNRSSKINATVRKVACGAAEVIPLIRVTNLVRTLQLLKKKDIRVIGTVPKSDIYLHKINLIGKIALIMGSESSGIRNLTKKTCDDLVSIPMFSNGSIISLNVAVATGICLFEVTRQKNNL